MKIGVRLLLLVLACCSLVSTVHAEGCKVVVLGFDEEVQMGSHGMGQQWLRLDDRQLRRFGSRDVLLFGNLEKGSEFSYLSGRSMTYERGRYYVECQDSAPTYLHVEGQKLRKISAQRFAERVVDFDTVKKVDVKGRKFSYNDEPFGDLSQLAGLLGVESTIFAAQARKQMPQNNAASEDNNAKAESVVLNYHGSTEKCNVALLGFDRDYERNNYSERWLKLDGQRFRDVKGRDVLLFEDLPTGSELGFFFGGALKKLTDRYVVECQAERPTLLTTKYTINEYDTKFEELDFQEFVELSADYKTIKRVKAKRRGFEVAESPLQGAESLAVLFDAAPVVATKEAPPVTAPTPQPVAAPARPVAKASLVAKKKNRYGVAVVIGNGNYQAGGKGVPDVEYAHNDASAIRDYVLNVLGYREGNVMFLEDATYVDFVSIFGTPGNAKGKLNDWLRPGKSDVFIYYSGHGAPALSNGQGYLLSVDADPQRVELSGYALQTFYENLAQLPAQSLTVVLDACFSGSSQGGTVVKNASSISLRLSEPQKQAPNATVLTASGLSEVASWDPSTKHGLFTRYFLDGVAGLADGADFGNGDGKVTLGELKGYLEEEVTYYARREYGRGQHPQVNGRPDHLMAELK